MRPCSEAPIYFGATEYLPPADLEGLHTLRKKKVVPILCQWWGSRQCGGGAALPSRWKLIDLLQPDASVIGGMHNFVRAGTLAAASRG